jgi:hypothetical protein
LRLNIPQSEIEIGVPAYTDPKDNRLRNILLMPFQQQRDYWCCADQTAMERDPLVLGNEPTQMVDSEDEAAQFGDSRGICEAARQQNYS